MSPEALFTFKCKIVLWLITVFYSGNDVRTTVYMTGILAGGYMLRYVPAECV